MLVCSAAFEPYVISYFNEPDLNKLKAHVTDFSYAKPPIVFIVVALLHFEKSLD